MLAWIALRARAGTRLASRIVEAAARIDGRELTAHVDACDETLLAFCSGMALASRDTTAAQRATLIEDWRRRDPATLLDFAAVGLGFGTDDPVALVEVLEALPSRSWAATSLGVRRAAREVTGRGGDARPGTVDDAVLAFWLAPRLSRRVLAAVAARRPGLVVRAVRAGLERDRPPGPRATAMLEVLARTSVPDPVDDAGRPAAAALLHLGRGRGAGRDPEVRLRAIEAAMRAGAGAAAPLAIDWLDEGLVRPGQGATDVLMGLARPYTRRADDVAHEAREEAMTRHAEGLLELLAARADDAARDAITRTGRRHVDPRVRGAALRTLAADPGAGPGPVADLARVQLSDPVAPVAAAATRTLVRVAGVGTAAAAVLEALPGVSRDMLLRGGAILGLAAREDDGFPVERAVRRLVEVGDAAALLAFLEGAADRERPPRLFEEPETGQADRLVDRARARLETLRWEEAEPDPDSEPGDGPAAPADPADRTATGRALILLAARHLATPAAAVRHRRGEMRRAAQARAFGVAVLEHGETEPPIREMGGDLLRLLREDRATTDEHVALLRAAIEHRLVCFETALLELGHAASRIRCPADAVARTRGLWRAAARMPQSGPHRSHPFVRPCIAQVRDRIPPELFGELVGHAMSQPKVRSTVMLRVLPRASADPAYDARFAEDPAAPGRGRGRGRRRAPLAARMVHEVRTATEAIAVEAVRLLGEPVAVNLTLECVGRTWPPQPGELPVIEVSPDPVLDLGTAGREVMVGVGLHELGHQAWDFREPGWRAEADRIGRLGLHPLQNLLCDERLERRLRSRSERYGRAIDAAVRHHFVRSEHRVPIGALAAVSGRAEAELRAAIAAGAVPGRLEGEGGDDEGDPRRDVLVIRQHELMRVPGLATPWQVFAWALRTGAERSSVWCGRARAALAFVPRRLRHLDLRQVGGVCERVAEALGGVEAERARRRAMRALADRDARIAALLGAIAHAAAAGRPDVLGGGGPLPDAPDPGADGDAGGGVVPPGPPAGIRPIARGATPAGRHPHDGDWSGNESPELAVPSLSELITPTRDETAHRELLGRIARHVTPLRRSLERLGRGEVDEPASRRGDRLDVGRARALAVAPRIDVLVGRREIVRADCELGLLVDRSGSMQGERIELARTFGCLLAEAARGVRGISGWTAAFDDDTWFELGPFERTAIATLEAGGGNNDAGALDLAGRRMLASRRRRRIIVLLSDGEPTQCTVAAFHDVASRLERRHGIAVVHVVIAQVERRAVLPRHVDLSEHGLEASIRCFARLLEDLVRRGARAVPAAAAVARRGGRPGRRTGDAA